jgi:hypothetical protein
MIKFIKEIFNSFKKDKPKITWFTDVAGLDKICPPIPALQHLPEWFKNIDRKRPEVDLRVEKENRGTIRHCPALPEFFSMGYILPLWTDVILDSDKEKWTYKIPNTEFKFTNHGNQQFKDFIPEHAKDFSFILKPSCPWYIKTPPGWSVLQLPVIYDYNPDFEVLPGIIRSDIHYQINQQMIIKKYGKIELKRGTPLAQYIPIKRDFLEHEIKFSGPTINPELMYDVTAQKLNIRSKWFGGYNWLKTQPTKSKGKCPFHK